MSSADRSRLVERLRALCEQATANESKAKEQVAVYDQILADRQRDAEQAKKRLAELEQNRRDLVTRYAQEHREIEDLVTQLESNSQHLERMP